MSGWGLVTAERRSRYSGDFAWTADPAHPLTVALETLVNPTTPGIDVTGPMADFDPSQPYSWLAGQLGRQLQRTGRRRVPGRRDGVRHQRLRQPGGRHVRLESRRGRADAVDRLHAVGRAGAGHAGPGRCRNWRTGWFGDRFVSTAACKVRVAQIGSHSLDCALPTGVFARGLFCFALPAVRPGRALFRGLSVGTVRLFSMGESNVIASLSKAVTLLTVAYVTVSGPSLALAQPMTYTYARRADTAGPLSSLFPPAIAADGTVAFYSQLAAGGAAIYTAAPDGSLVQKAASGAQFSNFTSASVRINAGGTVAFAATATVSGASEIYTASPAGTLTRVATTQSGGGFVGLLEPSINAGSTVAFIGFPSAGVTSVYTAAPGGSPALIASPGGVITSFARSSPINTGGSVAFFASVAGGGEAVYTLAPGGSPVQIANTSGPFADFFNQGRVALNDSGTVGFVASLDAGGQGLYKVAPGGSPVEIANTSGPFSSFGSPSINALDVLTFTADLDAGGRDLYVLPPGGLLTRLIGTGDPLDGSTITGFAFPSNTSALNDAGQIAFVANLADGRQGVFVATPVPEPTSLAFLGACGVAAFVHRRRRLV